MSALKIKSERDFWSGIMFIAVGAGFAIGAFNYSMGPPCRAGEPCATSLLERFVQLSAHPGAGYFPLGLATLLAVLGCLVVFKALTIESADGDRIGSIAWKPLVIIVFAIVVFGLMLERLGLVPSIPVLILIVSFAGHDFSWKTVVVVAAVLTAMSYAIFIAGLKLTIPVWPWFMR